ncbi:unnamed protein product [Microthlaspi erraticum]|uniref:Reverse transcriptase zinc-binding domain-containing protein n=1 Tax=Microthlaspi erraticum TaxID=1685480 RepID=A0A6D2LEP7_9BRAS|nr:unnamed protein product [Microthlaspi erraticum]
MRGDGVWTLPRGRHPIARLLRTLLPSSLNLSPLAQDTYTWLNRLTGIQGNFSSSETWYSLHPAGPAVAWAEAVWFSQNIPKHAFIHWVVARNRLPTRDRLRSWGLLFPDSCLLCGTNIETHEHLFFECPYASEVWSTVFDHSPLQQSFSFADIQAWILTAAPIDRVKVICKLLFQSSIYEIWKERNSRLHRAVSKPPALVIREIQSTIRRKLYVLDMAISDRSTITQPPQETYLATWFGFFQR